MDVEATATRPRRRFTVDDYYRMAEAGVLRPDDRVELIDGEIVEVRPIGSLHASVVDTLNRLLVPAVGDRAIVRVQGPIRLDAYSEPEPDLALLHGRPDGYVIAHPGPTDVLLVIEVADTTAAYDRGVKLPLYARAGIPEYWIVDLPRKVLEILRAPAGDHYADREELGPGTRVAPDALPQVLLDIADILGAPAP